MTIPLTPSQLTWGCHASALILYLVIVAYALSIVRRVGGDGIFARVARDAAAASAAFALCNGFALFMGNATALAAIEAVGAALLLVGSYTLYTLVRVE